MERSGPMAQGVHLRPVPSARDPDYGGQVGAKGMGLIQRIFPPPAQSPLLLAFLFPALLFHISNILLNNHFYILLYKEQIFYTLASNLSSKTSEKYLISSISY